MASRTRIGTACATVAFASLLSGGSAAFAAPGCPAGGTRGPCAVHASASAGYILADGFTPRSDVRFEVFKSKGGARIYGPVTRQTDGRGQRNAPGNLDNLKAGHYIVVNDMATDTVKTLILDPVRLTDIDWAANTVAGISSPDVDVGVAVEKRPGDDPFIVRTHSDSSGRWSADLGSFDIKPGHNVSAVVNDEDNDASHAHVFETGCSSVGFCVLYADMTNDVVGADHMTPDSDVRFEVIRGGKSILDFTLHTDKTGGAEEEVGFDHGIDLVAGDRVTARDTGSGVTKHVRIVSLSITSVDASTEVVEGTAPAGSTLTLGCSGPKPFDLVADPDDAWSYDFDTIGHNVAPNDFCSAVITEEDSDNGQPDWVKAQRGTLEPDCIQDEITICGTSAPEGINTQTGGAGVAAAVQRGGGAARRLKVFAGGRNDTVVTTLSRATRSVTIDTGTGKLDKVVMQARKGASGSVKVGGRSRRLVVVLPKHAWGINANVTGTKNGDRMTTRRFGGKGRSSGGYRLAGKGGNDLLKGGDGSDVLVGGPGRDTCFADANDTVRSCEIVK